MTKKIAYVISNVDRWVAFEWIHQAFEKSDKQIEFIILSQKQGYLCNYLKAMGAGHIWLPLTSKLSYISILYRLIVKFRKAKYDVVHCHFLDATICGLTAGFFTNIPSRIYTRHHGNFHINYAPKGVYLDRYCNRLSTKIVAISKVVQKILIDYEKVSPSKIVLIHHGFDLTYFDNAKPDKINKIKLKYGLSTKPVIGVASRFIEWKGVQHIIPAFKQFIQMYPHAVLVLANARGPYNKAIQGLLSDIPEKNYCMIPFEKDIFSLFQSFDMFIHTPVDREVEAFGQVYIESLAAGIPSIFTLSGIANEFIKNEENAILVAHKSEEEVFSAMLTLYSDIKLRRKITQKGKEDIQSLFHLDLMVKKLTKLYCE